MVKENKITIGDFLNCQICVIDMLYSIEKNNDKELENLYSKIFPHGKIKISDLFHSDLLPLHHRIYKHVRIFLSLPDYFS